MTQEIIDIDLYGNPILRTSMIKMLTSAAKIQLKNRFNNIEFTGVNEKNYFTYFSKKIKSEKGIYLIHRIESPIIDDVKYMYIGSSCCDLSSRVSKFVRFILNLTTPGDRYYAYCDLYVKKFGRNLDNTYVTFFEIPKEFDTIILESDVRFIEGELISDCKKEYGNVVANKIDKPLKTSKISSLNGKKPKLNKEDYAILPNCYF